MGMNISQMLGSDPDVLRYQLMQQEMQRYNQYQDPRMNLASTLGGLLGGGVVNVAQGRNFFQSNNPILKKAGDLQRIYNETASSIDPNTDPAEFYKSLQRNLADSGYGQQAAMAGQEAYKYTKAEKELSLKEREVAAKEATVEKAKPGYQTDAGPAIFKDGKFYVQTDKGEVPYSKAEHGPMYVMQGETLQERLLRGNTPGGGTPKKIDTTSRAIIVDGKLIPNPNWKP